MIFNMTGGGNPLNFKVVGGTSQPSNPKENTIWVKTENINNWYFSATQPEGLQEWDVWISTRTSSPIEFNALKKNGIQVYPLYAKQYVSGAWVDVAAKSYQNNEWAAWWDGHLYNHGDICESYSGGYHVDSMMTNLNPSLTFNTTHIQVKASGKSGNQSYVKSQKLIDLTDVKTIRILADTSDSNYGGSRADAYVRKGDSSSKAAQVFVQHPTSVSPEHEYTIDVSALSGEYYVGFGVWFAETATYYNNIYELQLLR